MRYALCTLALAAALAPARAGAAPEVTVHAVVLHGNDAISDSDILGRLATHPPEGVLVEQRYDYDPVAVEADRLRIERLYRERGYFGARVEEVHHVNLGAGRIGVRFDIVEGEPARIERVDIRGIPADFDPPERLHLAFRRIEEGEIIRHQNYLTARDRLRRALREDGYAHARVTGSVRIDRTRTRAFVRLAAETGPRVRYGDIGVSGLSRLPESVVRNRVAWRPGEVFSPEKMETTEGRLYELGYFSSVRLDYPREGDPEVIDVDVRAVEGARRELRLGGGLGVDNTFFEARARGGYLVRGFWDPRLTLRLDARPAYRIQRGDLSAASLGGEATVGLQRIDFLVPRAQGSAQIAARSREFEAYEARGGILRLGWDVPLFEDRFEFRAGWQLRPFFRLVNLHPALDPDHGEADPEAIARARSDVSPYRLGAFEQSLVVDLRDSILAPTRGAYFSLRSEQGGPAAGGSSDLTYASVTSEARGFLPVGDRVTVAARARVGSAIAGDIPLTQRYFSGGASDHRGFGNRRLSPTTRADPDEIEEGEDPVARYGGGALVETSYELRTRMTRIGDEWLGLSLFTDGGDVTPRLEDLDPRELQWAIGAGLRYNTIIGPIRFDVGYRVTDLPEEGGPVGDDRLVFHFSIGEAF